MEIGVGDPDIPRNQTVRSDFDSFVRHDKCAIQQGEITNDGRAIHSQSKGTPGVNRNVIAEAQCLRRFISHEAEDLRRLAIKTFAKVHVWRNRILPPITFHSAVGANVAHVENLPEA